MISDRISSINLINRRKYRKTPRRVQAAISTKLPDEILISSALEVRNWKENTLRSRETRERGVLTVNWIELSSDAYIREEQAFL